MTLQELKAHAYECIASIEAWQNELKATQQKINEELAKPEPKEEPKNESKDKK